MEPARAVLDDEVGLIPLASSDGEDAQAGTWPRIGRALVAGLGLTALGAVVLHLGIGRRAPQAMGQAITQLTVVSSPLNIPWECARYAEGQDDAWCQAVETTGADDGFSYKYVGDGEGAGLCAECWCCKQRIPPKNATTGEFCAAPGEDCSGPWCCGGTDFECVDDSPLLGVAGVYCVNRNAAEVRRQRLQAQAELERLRKQKELAAQGPEGPSPWQCYHYGEGEDNEWCQTIGNQSGWEYRYVGGEVNLCEDCWCCARNRMCAKRGEDCRSSTCCEQEGYQCFQKDDTWAECKETCTEEGWRCNALGQRTEMSILEDGADIGQPCAAAGKCKFEGHQCYQKDDYFSACKVQCHDEEWSCKEYGERTPVTSTAGGTTCAWGGDNCSPMGCCVGEGLQCYARDEYWSRCLSSCNSFMNFGANPEKWSCKEHGPATAISLGCSFLDEDCTKTKSCCSPGYQCIQKDDRAAFCTQDLNPPGWVGTILGGGAHGETRSPMAALGTDVMGLSLYCFMAVLPSTPEESLRMTAEHRNASIFGCDAYDVFKIWPSTGGNAGQFVDVWDLVLQKAAYKDSDWVVKVDADSVFFPQRLRAKLETLHAPIDAPLYIKNVVEDSGFSGACEVFSAAAIDLFAGYHRVCFAATPAGSPEEAYIKGCMDMIGASYMVQLDVLRTPSHNDPCTDQERVTFHPRRDAESWETCYNEATASEMQENTQVL